MFRMEKLLKETPGCRSPLVDPSPTGGQLELVGRFFLEGVFDVHRSPLWIDGVLMGMFSWLK